jgi:hypothetical protein
LKQAEQDRAARKAAAAAPKSDPAKADAPKPEP